MLGLKRFGKYIVVGFTTFIFDMVLLILAVSWGMPYHLAVSVAFLIAITVNYVISRRFVFNGTTRQWNQGFFYFLIFAFGGAILTTGLVVFLVEIVGLHYLTSRVIVACIVGTIFYLTNLHFNFRMAGKNILK
ncbi:MAG: GtrA family protein [bacterium]|nr:GtrA family protein [bacterium]